MTPAYSSPPQTARPSSPLSPGAKLAYHLNNPHQPMDGRQPEYTQSDQASAAQYPPGHHTPTSEYGVAPSSARSGSFPDYIQRSYPGQGANAGGMAQATSPSMPLPDGQTSSNHAHDMKSNNDVPIDPSIAQATSPTYPPQPQYSPYTPQHDQMQYPGHPGVYGRPEWAGGQYAPQHAMPPYGHPASSGPPTPAMVSPGYQGGHPLSTVYSFVPIPGAQQHKRPRRRYEEIERMYKCGWNGCEKAYGTLNHLNAHVTMQSHGTKRTPEEFKEIRKEWKAKKKEEELQRKAEEERNRVAADNRSTESNGPETPLYGHMRTPVGQTPGGPQLPPIGYTPAGSQAQAYGNQSPAMEGMPPYPQSPYGQNNMYQQHADNGTSYQQ